MTSDEELDRRFRELIRSEFGDVAGARDPDEADPPPWSPPPRQRFQRPLPDPIEYFNLSQAIDETEPDDDFERWNPAGERLSRPRLRVLIGALLVLLAVSLAAMVLAGWRPSTAVSVLIVVISGLGLGLLLSSLPRWRHIDGDGAQL